MQPHKWFIWKSSSSVLLTWSTRETRLTIDFSRV